MDNRCALVIRRLSWQARDFLLSEVAAAKRAYRCEARRVKGFDAAGKWSTAISVAVCLMGE